MANRVRGARKAAAAKRGHRRISRSKSSAGSRKAAWARWGRGKRKRARKKR